MSWWPRNQHKNFANQCINHKSKVQIIFWFYGRPGDDHFNKFPVCPCCHQSFCSNVSRSLKNRTLMNFVSRNNKFIDQFCPLQDKKCIGSTTETKNITKSFTWIWAHIVDLHGCLICLSRTDALLEVHYDSLCICVLPVCFDETRWLRLLSVEWNTVNRTLATWNQIRSWMQQTLRSQNMLTQKSAWNIWNHYESMSILSVYVIFLYFIILHNVQWNEQMSKWVWVWLSLCSHVFPIPVFCVPYPLPWLAAVNQNSSHSKLSRSFSSHS